MSKVLYITAHPLDESNSSSLAVGKAFMQAYRIHHVQDEIVHLDLYNSRIPQLDADVFRGWKKLGEGNVLESLSPDERYKITRLNELVDQFVAFDKYVFVTPMWNFSYPPVLKAYIDAIAVAGKTFKYTENGPVGLLGTKKAIHIQSRGGLYSEGKAAQQESGHHHLSVVLDFFGIPSIEGLFVEGHNQFPDRAHIILADAIERAQQLAVAF